MPVVRFTFCATDRLHRRTEFLQTQRRGVRLQTPHFVLYISHLPNQPAIRLGTAVSRRVGNAVVRNRIKRRIREYFRLTLRSHLPQGTDVVIIARAGADCLKMASIAAELGGVTARLRARLQLPS